MTTAPPDEPAPPAETPVLEEAAAAELSPPVDAPPEALEPTTRAYPFAFTGHWKEYFRIWIVNLFLSVITVGLYSPWAKVRRTRYLYGNTWVANANFDYHGNPVAILKGRLVAVAALVAYNAVEHYLPSFGWAALLVLMLVAPWLITRSLRFNAVNSSYRNLRFQFHGTYREGLLAISPLLALPVLGIFLADEDFVSGPVEPIAMAAAMLPMAAFALGYPYVVGAVKRLHVRRSAFGAAAFDFGARIRSFYGIYVLAGLIFAVCSFILGATAFMLLGTFDLAWVAISAVYLLAGAIVLAFTRARVGNLTFNNATLDGRVRYVSTLSAAKLAWIYLGNLLAIVASFGLLVPWAVTRTAHYRASCLSIACDGDLEGFLGDVAKPVGATGEELGEFFDVDLSL
ncbi:MAG: YjgN family protein [Lysobacter sp.]|nr:YjgN family protein [Lysobacter sp.]